MQSTIKPKSIITGKPRPLDRQKVVSAALRAAKRNSRSRGRLRKAEAPNKYTIGFNAQEWASFWSVRPKEASAIAEELRAKISASEMIVEGAPIVHLACAPSLPLGVCVIDVSFSEPNYDEIDGSFQSTDSPQPREAQTVLLFERATEIDSDVIGASKLERMRAVLWSFVRKVLKMLSVLLPLKKVPFGLKPSKSTADFNSPPDGERTNYLRTGDFAFLSFPELGSFIINAGDSIGVRRSTSEGAPDICLDEVFPDLDLSSMSGLHGDFGFTGAWQFRNTGQNGTLVVKANGERCCLDVGESCDIDDTDKLFFTKNVSCIFLTK